MLEAALIGYKLQAERIANATADLERQLADRKGRPSGSTAANVSGAKRQMSAEGRARIAEAQRRRWAAARRKKANFMKAGR